jgi:formylglycine-generating enzyme required for sulfatase activity
MCGPPGGSNTANCRDFIHEIENPVNVGSYANSPSPYGTLDQAGNVLEWTETVIGGGSGSNRAARGGAYWLTAADTAAWSRFAVNTDSETRSFGFRVASIVPEPGTGLLVSFGLLGLSVRRRLNA